jgi:hypothetical protein
VTNCFGADDDAARRSEDSRARAGEQPADRSAPHDERASSIACLAHDFNNLLTIVVTHLSALQTRVDTELAERHVDPAMRACRRGADIAKSLAEFALRSVVAPGDAGAEVCLLPQPAEPARRDHVGPSERREVVLIVGGDDAARSARRRDLVDDGFGVLEARDICEAEALLAAIEEIGAVVLDATSPGDAMERDASARARDVRRDVAIVLIAPVSDAPVLGPREVDGAIVLAAPVSRAELAGAIARGRASEASGT